MSITMMTREQLVAARAKGDATRNANRARLRRRFLDAGEWDRLAQQRGIRLPMWGTPVTTGGMRRWLQRLGLTVTGYYAWYGSRRLSSFIENNPDWPLRAWVGLLLEQLDARGEL